MKRTLESDNTHSQAISKIFNGIRRSSDGILG